MHYTENIKYKKKTTIEILKTFKFFFYRFCGSPTFKFVDFFLMTLIELEFNDFPRFCRGYFLKERTDLEKNIHYLILSLAYSP